MDVINCVCKYIISYFVVEITSIGLSIRLNVLDDVKNARKTP